MWRLDLIETVGGFSRLCFANFQANHKVFARTNPHISVLRVIIRHTEINMEGYSSGFQSWIFFQYVVQSNFDQNRRRGRGLERGRLLGSCVSCQLSIPICL